MPLRTENLIVEIRDPLAVSAAERAACLRICRKTNLFLYAVAQPEALEDKEHLRRFAASFGLVHMDANPLSDEDGVSSLAVTAGKSGRGYVPYTAQRLLWHTDGYYNPPELPIRSFVLHCVHPAVEGGENRLLDPEIACLLLGRQNPDWVTALMQPDAMTIPANTEDATCPRGAVAGPVFSADPDQGDLNMRYTARTRSIAWCADPVVQAARAALEALLAGDSPYVYRVKMSSGQGLLCNNVLHDRSAFIDAPDRPRLLYRARYLDRIAATHWRDTIPDLE